jgi:hypothetical protein
VRLRRRVHGDGDAARPLRIELHDRPAPRRRDGLAGLARALEERGASETPGAILRDWAATVALDGVLDRGAELSGREAWRLRTETLDARINWNTAHAHSRAGAPPNGSDYVRLRGSSGTYLDAARLRSLEFDGADALEPRAVEWTVERSPEGRPGDPALFSGSGPNFDRGLVRELTVPASDPTLNFRTRWNTEPLWDFGFVQVSTDGGVTWKSLANADTTREHDPLALPLVVENLPGLTGDSGGWRTESFDLSTYAGQTVLLGFRYITDPGMDLPGWWIDDVVVGGTVITDGSSLAGWRTPTQVRPVPVRGYTVQLVGYTAATLAGPPGGTAFVHTLELGDGHETRLGPAALGELLGGGRGVDVVAVLVMHDDPAERVEGYARYVLKANEVTQPGG